MRDEYAHIPLADYLRARIAIITKLLDRRSLFSSPMGQRGRSPRARTSTPSSSVCARSRRSSWRRHRRPRRAVALLTVPLSPAGTSSRRAVHNRDVLTLPTGRPVSPARRRRAP
ncbi:hypothetical protein NKG05_18690 [Oerskovia sp. M15]